MHRVESAITESKMERELATCGNSGIGGFELRGSIGFRAEGEVYIVPLK